MKVLRITLFCLLFLFAGSFLGIMLATIVDAGKGQMLAGGAIVLGYGVIGAGLGLLSSILITIYYKSNPRLIILLNKVLAVLIFCLMSFFWVKHQIRESKKNNQIGVLLFTKPIPSKTLSIKT